MINSLGLLAALTPPDAAQPQPAPADDPAVFAAALVAALGLQQPVLVTVAPPQPLAGTEETAEDGDQPAEGDGTPVASAPADGEGEMVAPIVARVTPDPDTVEESETFERIPGAKKPDSLPAVSPATKGEARPARIDRVSDEPATPASTDATKQSGGNSKASADAPRGPDGVGVEPASKVPAVPAAPAIPVTAKADPAPVPDAQGESAVVPGKAADRATQGDGLRASRKAPKEKAAALEQPVPTTVDRPFAHTPAIPVPSVPVTPPAVAVVEVPNQEGPASAREVHVLASDPPAPRAPAAPPAKDLLPGSSDGSVPPQSVQERTARAMAENVRIGRQLAELLGEENVTALKVELGSRPATGAMSAVVPKQAPIEDGEAPVVWQRMPLAQSGDTISGSRLPREEMTPKADRKAVQGTFAREAIEPIIARPFAREPVTITTVTSRSEIVRMVANASLAASPNLAQTEGNPAVAKAPAPSVTPSLPDVRQELPVTASRGRRDALEDTERRTTGESGTSADAPPSSVVAANNPSANKSADAPENGRASREARNLPSHESTEQKAAGSADRVTLQVADDEGRQTRIRVSVTGNQIRAVITPPDSMSARQLEQRMDQLHETLVRQGFTDPKVVVRTAPELTSEAAAVAGATSGSQERSTVPAGRDQPAGDQRQGRGQREQDRGDGHRHPQGHSRERDPRDRRR